jgi:putative transposase
MTELPIFRRRKLPHWDIPGATYFITSCLADSIPAQGLLDLTRYRRELQQRERPVDVSERDWDDRLWKLHFARLEQWIDHSPEGRWLERTELAEIVENALLHFAGERCDVLAYAVMPSHFHWVFRARDEWVASIPEFQRYRSPRERLIQSVRKFTSHRCNELLGRSGAFWQHEAYDHCVRDADELERIIRYVEENPVKAGLAKDVERWRWSSARIRFELGLKWGDPIPKSVPRGDKSLN